MDENQEFLDAMSEPSTRVIRIEAISLKNAATRDLLEWLGKKDFVVRNFQKVFFHDHAFLAVDSVQCQQAYSILKSSRFAGAWITAEVVTPHE